MSSSTSIRGAAGRRVGILLLGLALACVGALSFAGSQAKAVPFSMDFTNGQVNLGFAFKGAEILPAPTTLGPTNLPDLWDARATQSTPGTGTPPNSLASFKPVGCLSQVTFSAESGTALPNDGQSGRPLVGNPDYPCEPNPTAATVSGDLNPANGEILIDETEFQFPIMIVPNPLDGSPVPITLAAGDDLVGTADAEGNLNLEGPVEVRVLTGLATNPLGTYCSLPLPNRNADGTGSGPLKLTSSYSLPVAVGFNGTPFTTLAGPGAVTGTWNVTQDSVSVGGADCATVNSVSKGLGGIWLGAGIDEPAEFPTCQDLGQVGTFPNCADAVAALGGVTVTGPSKVKRGKVASYKVKVTNTGTADATGVRLNISGRGVSLNTSVGSITAGGSRTVTVKAKFKTTGKVKATFKATSSNAGTKSATKTITVVK